MLDALQALVDSSLVRQAVDQDAEPRFTMLETIREYALNRLIALGDEAPTRQAHDSYFLAYAERAALELRGPDQGAWFDRLEVEQANLRLALAWALERDTSAALRLTSALERFWIKRGSVGEGRGWLSRALRASGEAAIPPPERSSRERFMHMVSWRSRRAIMLLRSAYLNRRQHTIALGRTRELALVLVPLSVVLALQGDLAATTTTTAEYLPLLAAIDDPWFRGLLVQQRGTRAMSIGHD
ncbi:MAG TPA: hypothetical protein VFU22_33055, partial [Roseiflexaceae bacterium]|nr:hypothetical protein [Roseiflexaceae bacterium]